MNSLINELWKIPFLRFLSPFILGIIVGDFLPIQLELLLIPAVFFSGLAFVYRPFLNHAPNYHRRWIFGSLISLSIFFISYCITANYNNIDTKIKTSEIILGRIYEPPKETAKSIKISLKVQEYLNSEVWVKDNSNILVYIEKDSLAKSLKYGDILLIKSNLKSIKNSGNPYEFNYEKYLHRNKIYFQSYQNSSQWIKLASDKGNSLYKLAYYLRNKALSIYKKTGISGNEFAILSALTLGVKDYLSDEIVHNYSHSGAMHVLAVSGLHVGIITMMLNFMLSFLLRNPKLRIIHTIVVIFALWLFAIITGLTPSVTRSALMFTFFIIGNNSGAKPHSLNSLAAAAFIILISNPNAVFHVGFQLSFLAVASILIFQPVIGRIFIFKSIIANKIWQLTSVSIAAQIGTTPVSIFYFHQFPVYALLTNIIVIPAAMLIMYLTVLLIIVAAFSSFANYIAIILSFVIKLLNQSTQFIENMPFSSVEFISLSPMELSIIYAVIILTTIMLFTKNKKLLFVVMALLIFMFSIRDFRYFKQLNNNKLIVFNTNKHSAIASISGFKMKLYADSAIINNKSNIKYLCSNIITECKINKFTVNNLIVDTTDIFPVKFIDIDKTKTAYLQSKKYQFKSDIKMKVDYLILGKNSSINIEYIANLFDFSTLIIDSSMPKWKQNIVEKECIQKNINFHNVNTEGAFVR